MQTLYNYGIRCAQDILDSEDTFLVGIPGIGPETAARLKGDSIRVVQDEKAELAALKKEEEAQARREARAMLEDAERRKDLLPEAERLIRVRGMSDDLIQKLELAGLHTVEELASVPSLTDLAEKSQVAAEKIDQL